MGLCNNDTPDYQRPDLSLPAEITNRPRIGIVSNPRSRRNRSQLPEVERILANHPAIHHCVLSGEDDTDRALEQFAAAGVNVLAINGGDGTVARVLTQLLSMRPFSQMPSIVLLPGGTTNMNAADIGMRGRLKKNIGHLVHWAESGHDNIERLIRPVLRVRHTPRKAARYGMFFGTGSITRGMEYCQGSIHTLGLTDEFGPAITTIRAIWGMLRQDPVFTAPQPTRVELDSGTDTSIRELNLLLISSLERLFLGFHPYWGDEDAPLHCTWLQKPTNKLLRVIPCMLRGRQCKHMSRENGYYSANATQIRLWLNGSFAIDGEIYHVDNEHPIIVDNGGELEFLRIGS